MGYILTEANFDFILIYLNFENFISSLIENIIGTLSNVLPLIIKSVIGYCHFYYQLGYGLIFYIYIYRRRKAKKTKNWTTFYGNSILNWLFFNITIFNKFVFDKNFIIYCKTKIFNFINSLFFIFMQSNNLNLKKLYVFLKFTKTYFINFVWTPIFKKSSYISFLTNLKRFSKRK